MNVRTARPDDLTAILETYAYAREQMRINGNPTQWGDHWPPRALIEEDVRVGRSFVVVDGAELCGVFVFLLGPDPTYATIEDGAWLNDEPYGVIHRIASNDKRPGILDAALKFCADRVRNLRIDTHPDNAIMRGLLSTRGFARCGIIHVEEDDNPRIAFQKIWRSAAPLIL